MLPFDCAQGKRPPDEGIKAHRDGLAMTDQASAILQATCHPPSPLAMIMVMSTISLPRQLGAAEVITFTTIGASVHRTGKARQLVGGRQVGTAAGLAIGRYPGERGYYLFYCDADWNPFDSTWHETVQAAKQAAEFE
ncbi:MAG: hypothetical protein A2147_08190 [Chloroflexi bacterium RBG_16_57_8]|nr:MAG: hypothetical protein A2147_08190 [Chloroflexi bacterium RBG_16_57_8]